MDPTTLPALQIPESIQVIVYLVGMLGFPIVVTLFVLSKLSDKLKGVDESLIKLSDRISERPMGLERSTDFVIYTTKALENELISGFREIVFKRLALEMQSNSKEEKSRVLTLIRRDVSAFLRPIFRSHQRFLSRFPTVGGNLGSLFVISAPSEDIEAGQTEARLVGQTFKDPAEATLALVMNNIHSFGHEGVFNDEDNNEEQLKMKMFAQLLGEGIPDDKSDIIEHEEVILDYPLNVIEKEKLVTLTDDSFKTLCTILRDEILEKVRLNTSEFESNNK